MTHPFLMVWLLLMMWYEIAYVYFIIETIKYYQTYVSDEIPSGIDWLYLLSLSWLKNYKEK